MAIVLNGTTGITAPAVDAALDATDLTGNIAAARITNALNATGSAPIYACRAWVNFNGTGTVAIRASGNVSSITDNGTGIYTVNFTTAMPDGNYSVVTTVKAVGSVDFKAPLNTTPTASSFSLYTVVGTSGTDSDVICAAVFR